MGAVNRHQSIALFEYVHEIELRRAYRKLHAMPPYARWRIALHEQLLPITAATIIDAPLTMFCVDLKLDHQGKLVVADEDSQRAIDDWERRYENELPYVFEIPLSGEE